MRPVSYSLWVEPRSTHYVIGHIKIDGPALNPGDPFEVRLIGVVEPGSRDSELRLRVVDWSGPVPDNEVAAPPSSPDPPLSGEAAAPGVPPPAPGGGTPERPVEAIQRLRHRVEILRRGSGGKEDDPNTGDPWYRAQIFAYTAALVALDLSDVPETPERPWHDDPREIAELWRFLEHIGQRPSVTQIGYFIENAHLWAERREDMIRETRRIEGEPDSFLDSGVTP